MNELKRVIPADDRVAALKLLARACMSFLPGKRLKVIVRIDKPEKTDLQTRALFGCAYKALEQQTGNEKDDLHTYFCGEFFGWKNVVVMGQTKRKPVRTTTKDENGDRDVIDTGTMADFYDLVQRRSAMVGFDVPDPDPMWWEKKAA